MKKLCNINLCRLSAVGVSAVLGFGVFASAEVKELHVDGRYFKDADDNIVVIHGFGQTYSPWFNEEGKRWSNYDVEACLAYNKKKIDEIIAAGWEMDFVRMHMDPYWSNTPGVSVTGENDISAFDFNRFMDYLNRVFVPMAEYIISKGMYVVMRPPGVCPEKIAVGDSYHKYLKKVWTHVAGNAKLRNNSAVMFELANEPVQILGTDGTYGASNQGHFDELSRFFQEIVDAMRAKDCNNILLVPGLSYQSNYSGFANAPITGDNIGYAIHVYPGWYGSYAERPSAELGEGGVAGYDEFAAGWQRQIAPVSDIAPIVVTEMDWAPAKYNKSWGKSITGEAYGLGFGANFKVIADRTANVSWMLFTGPELLAQYDDKAEAPASGHTFFTDPEACIRPIYRWFKEYAQAKTSTATLSSLEFREGARATMLTGTVHPLTLWANYSDGTRRDVSMLADFVSSAPAVAKSVVGGNIRGVADGGATLTASFGGKKCSINVTVSTFPLVKGVFNPSIWENGTFDQDTHTITTGKYGFAGWNYASGVDMSSYKYCVAAMTGSNDCGVSFRMYDRQSYWTDCAIADFGSKQLAVFNLHEMVTDKGRTLDPSHIYIAGFWSLGGKPFTIESVYLTNNDNYVSDIEVAQDSTAVTLVDVLTVSGVVVRRNVELQFATAGLPAGLYIVGGKKVLIN